MATKAVIIGNPHSGRAGDEGYLEGFADTLRGGGRCPARDRRRG